MLSNSIKSVSCSLLASDFGGGTFSRLVQANDVLISITDLGQSNRNGYRINILTVNFKVISVVVKVKS